jgi:DNA polymerase III psi subunit
MHEEYVIYWLVIRRNTATIEQLQADVKLNLSSSELMQTLSLLRGGRCLVELDEDDCYVLDGVVLKYLTIQSDYDNWYWSCDRPTMRRET